MDAAGPARSGLGSAFGGRDACPATSCKCYQLIERGHGDMANSVPVGVRYSVGPVLQ